MMKEALLLAEEMKISFASGMPPCLAEEITVDSVIQTCFNTIPRISDLDSS